MSAEFKQSDTVFSRVHPAVAVITLGATDELTVLRDYESGSDQAGARDPEGLDRWG